MTWHATDDLLHGYVAGTADSVSGASVEQHVLHCADCRTRLNVLVPAPPLEAVWTRVRDRVEAAPVSPAERVLGRLGLGADDAMLLWQAPAFRAPWLAATTVALGFATLAALLSTGRGLLLLLLLSPLVPVAGVALAYGPDSDEAYEVALSTPYPALRLVLLRTLAVLLTTLPLILLAGVLVPGPAVNALAWLVPSLMTTLLTLACTTWLDVSRAAMTVGIGWWVVVGGTAGRDLAASAPTLADPSLVLQLVVACAAAVALWLRADHVNHLKGTS